MITVPIQMHQLGYFYRLCFIWTQVIYIKVKEYSGPGLCVVFFIIFKKIYIYMKTFCWKIFIGNFNQPHLNSRWSSVVSRPHGWKTPEIQMWFGVFSELFHFKMEERSDQVETNSSTLNSNGNNFLIIKISPFFKTMKSVLSRMLLFLFFFFLFKSQGQSQHCH